MGRSAREAATARRAAGAAPYLARPVHRDRPGSVAQLVEQWTENPCVGGSSPSRATARRPSWRQEGRFPFSVEAASVGQDAPERTELNHRAYMSRSGGALCTCWRSGRPGHPGTWGSMRVHGSSVRSWSRRASQHTHRLSDGHRSPSQGTCADGRDHSAGSFATSGCYLKSRMDSGLPPAPVALRPAACAGAGVRSRPRRPWRRS